MSLRVPANPVNSQGISRIYVVEGSGVFTVVFIVHYGQIFTTVKIPFRFSRTVEQVANKNCFRSSCDFRCIWLFLPQANRAVHITCAWSIAVHVTTLSWLLKVGCLEVWNFTDGMTQIPREDWSVVVTALIVDGGRRSSGLTLLVLHLGTWLRWVDSVTPRPLYSKGKKIRYTSNWGLGGPHSCTYWRIFCRAWG